MIRSSTATRRFFAIICMMVLLPASATWAADRDIERLMVRYAHTTDAFTRGQVDRATTLAEYGEIFTPDATIGLKGQMSLTGPAAWLELVAASSTSLKDSQHLIGSQYLVWDADRETARLTSYLQATRVAHDGTVSRIVGTYRARAVQLGGAWRFDELILDLMLAE